ncbi:UNVERIFIED_ORG: regulator of chromosome condensation (RCC1) repeat-containing protein [Anoxybacillus amylolyticus]
MSFFIKVQKRVAKGLYTWQAGEFGACLLKGQTLLWKTKTSSFFEDTTILHDVQRVWIGERNMFFSTKKGVFVLGLNIADWLLKNKGFAHEPVHVPWLDGAEDISSSSHHLLLIRDGAVYAWGENIRGCCGDSGRKTRTCYPLEIPDPVSVLALGGNSLILSRKGEVYALGCNADGVLGYRESGTLVFQWSKKPVRIELPPIRKIAGGGKRVIALSWDGKVYAWGRNEDGEVLCSRSPVVYRPLIVFDKERVVDVAAGERHAILLTENGKVYAWGDALNGKLGIPPSKMNQQPYDHAFPPVPVDIPDRVQKVFVSGEMSFAMTECGIWCWGRDLFKRFAFCKQSEQGLWFVPFSHLECC